MEDMPAYIPIVFGITTLVTVFLFYWVVKNSAEIRIQKNAGKMLFFLIIWLGVQAFLALTGVYYERTDVLPPTIFLYGILPALLLILLLFLTKTGKWFMDSLSLDKLTYIHIVRIPVEMVLLGLYIHKAIPQMMTFEGWNFDILAGLTAPLIIYFGFNKGMLGRKVILGWNIIGLSLLLTILVIAVLSAPFPLQQLAFDQPNVGLLYFPYSWLPTYIVPTVILAHLIAIRRLTKKDREAVI